MRTGTKKKKKKSHTELQERRELVGPEISQRDENGKIPAG